MKSKQLFPVLTLTIVTGMLFSLLSAPVLSRASAERDQPDKAERSESSDLENGIVLVANKLVDLKWDPTKYPASPGRFKRWELYRGTTPDAPFQITSGTDQTTGFYRDRSIADDGTYYFRLVVVRCKDPCLTQTDEVLFTYFTDSITTGVFSGYLTRSLELIEGTYPVGFCCISCTAAVFVEDGAALSVSKNARLTKTPDISHGALSIHSGSVSVKGTSLSSILLTLGEYGGIESDCTAALDSVAFTNVNMNINAACQLNVAGGGGTFTVFATDASKATIQKAYIEGYVEIEKQAMGTLSNNHILGGVEIDGSYAAAIPKAQGFLNANVISTPYHNEIVQVLGGGTVFLTENTLSYTGIVDTESAVLVFASDDGTRLVARSNRVENGKIFMGWNPNVEITDNVLVGNGSAITVGCPLCGTAQQASGSIERNTLQTGWGFEMWDGSQFLTLKHNCIRGNNPGMTVVNTLPVNLNTRENYWGAANGPRHPTNPGGSGDEIVGAKVDFSNWDTTDSYCREAPPPAAPDFTPIGMEVTQVVQTMDNTVPLAADRSTVVRLYALSTHSAANVTAELRAYRGTALVGTLTPIMPITVPGLTPIISLRRNLTGGWYFRLPADWTAAGDLHLVAEVNQDNSIDELNHSNNSLERTVRFTPRRTLNVALVPIRYHTLLTDDTPTQGQLQAMTWMIRSMYPLFDVQIEIIPSPMEWTIPLLTKAFQGNVTGIILNRLYDRLNLFNRNRTVDKQIDQIYGVFPFSSALSFCTSDPRWNAGKGRAAYCTPWDAGLPHEIGHNLGLRHPNTPDSCGAVDPQTDWPFNSATINEVGVDLRGFVLKQPEDHDIMSYCTNVTQWISPYHATKLFNSDGLPQPTNRTEVDTTYVFARGQVTATGEVTLLPAWQLTTSTPPENPPQGSTYCLQLQNSGGGLLSSYCFDPQLVEHETGIAKDSTEFEIALPIASGAERLVVTRDGSPVAQSAASAAAPTVTLTYPNGGETLNGTFTIEWTALDADGDALFCHLLYSVDDGLTWTPLAEYLTEQEYKLDTSVLAGTEVGRLRVMASDGFHTAQDDSDGAFSTPDNPPQAGIGTPLDGESGYLPLRLAGAGSDLEDGSLPDENLTWVSDLDGNLGSGRDLLLEELTVGTHHITLTVTDSQGQSGFTSIHYTVNPQPHVYLPAVFH